MSNPHLLSEILDYTIDLLQNIPETLKECCLVSKSWVPRTRKHLFADIKLYSVKHLQLWKKTFPDPSSSPGCYAYSLLVYCPKAVTTADADEGGWIRGFSRLIHLNVWRQYQEPQRSGDFSGPILRSLAHPQIALCVFYRVPKLSNFRSRLFLPPSGGSGLFWSRDRERQARRLWASDRNSGSDLTCTHWYPRAHPNPRDGTYHTSATWLTEWSSLPKPHVVVASGGSPPVDKRVGGGMF